MKTFLACVTLATCLSFPGRANDEAGVPSRIDDLQNQRIAWIAADVAIENGQLRRDLLGERWEELHVAAQRNGRALEGRTDLKAGSERPCSSFSTQSPAEDFDPAETLKDLTEYGKTIVSGRVVAIREGFWHGLPASLLKIEGAWLKGESTGATFFLYPFAHIDTAEGPICSKVVGNRIPPEVGDRVIVFSYSPAFEFEGGRVVSGDFRNRVFYEHRNGSTRIPTALQSMTGNPATAFDELQSAVQASVARPRER